MANSRTLRMSGDEKIALFSNMSTMLGAGIPIAETVESLLDEAKGAKRIVLTQLRDDLSAGHHVSRTFAQFPKIFDKVTVNLTKAAEESGTLETTLKDVEKNLRKQMELGDKVKSAMMYPMLVMVVFAGVLLVMLLVVIPKIAKVFERLKVELALPTKLMIMLSNTLINQPLLVLSVSVVVGLLSFAFYWYKREVFFKVLFSLPGISQLVRQMDVSYFARSMYLLLSSGVPMVMSLELAEEVLRKAEMRKLVKNARNRTVAGYPFSSSLRSKQKLIPEMVIKLMEVGEKTGTLETSMQSIADHMDYQVAKGLSKATTLLEPLMLVTVAVVVGGMMMAIISPIYGLISQVGAM